MRREHATTVPRLSPLTSRPRPRHPSSNAYNLERVPQTLPEDAVATLSYEEICKCIPPRVRNEARTDGAPRARTVYGWSRGTRAGIHECRLMPESYSST